mmetsp:Transcript_33441/g.84243  ORF Transcript_33441/g.84243 Transcript_33441/m.84243 type:complete len:201 (-) Transcript_33441:211-813(-)
MSTVDDGGVGGDVAAALAEGRRAAREDKVKHHTHGPDVGGRGQRLVRQHLGRAAREHYVDTVLPEGAHGVLVAAANAQLHPEPHVGNLHRAGGVHQQVLGLKVIVCDAARGLAGVVQPRDAGGDGAQDVHAALHRHVGALSRHVLAEALGAKFQGDKDVRAGDTPAVEEGHAGGLVQRREQFHLALNELEQLAAFFAGRP